MHDDRIEELNLGAFSPLCLAARRYASRHVQEIPPSNRGECRAASILWLSQRGTNTRWGFAAQLTFRVCSEIILPGPGTYYCKRGQIFLPVNLLMMRIFAKFGAWMLDMGEKNVKGYFVVPVCLPDIQCHWLKCLLFFLAWKIKTKDNNFQFLNSQQHPTNSYQTTIPTYKTNKQNEIS